jgi:hypothetical protein
MPDSKDASRFHRFFAFFEKSAPHVFEGQEADPGRLSVSADAPIKTQRACQPKEVLATTAAIGSSIIGPAARSIRLEIGRQAPDQLQK